MQLPKIDIVMQATGTHGWNVCDGYINALRNLGMLNRVFKPIADWDATDVKSDDGLFEYLKNPNGDLMLLVGFDWHSQPLHNNKKWRDAWISSKVPKVMLALESIFDQDTNFKNTLSSDAFKSAAPLVQASVVCVEKDLPLAQQSSLRSFYQPYGIDETIFKSTTPFHKRQARAFFRGKTTPYFSEQTYRTRREYIKIINEYDLADIIPFSDGPVTPEQLVLQYNSYRIAINLPSITMAGHPSRITEALACGCCLVTPLTHGKLANEMFMDKKHLYYYNSQDPKSFLECLELALTRIQLSARIAAHGQKEVFNKHTIAHRITEICDFMGLSTKIGPAIRKKLSNQPDSPRVLFVRTDAIGDNILASAMLEPIKKHYKGCELAVACSKESKPLYEACPFIDKIFEYTFPREGWGIEELLAIAEEIRSFKPTIAINSTFSRDAVSDLIAINSIADSLITTQGNAENSLPESHAAFLQYYTHITTCPDNITNEIDRNLHMLKVLGIECNNYQPRIWLTKEDEDYAEKLFKELGLAEGKVIAVCPGSRLKSKQYPHFNTVLDEVEGAQFIALGNQEEFATCESLIRQSKSKWINLAGKTTLRQTAAILKRCKVYLGNDTACAHIANAVGIPQVVILGGGHFGRFFPYSPLTSVVSLPLDCYGCTWRCKFTQSYCITELNPTVIAEALYQTLKEKSDKPRVFLQKTPPNYTNPRRSFNPSSLSNCKIIEV